MTQTAHDVSNGEQIYGLALSAGIGGLELGIRLALGAERYRTVCYVEWESYAASTLVARMAAQEMDDAPIWDDVKTFDGRPWRGVVDLLTAGYPCQPFSNAGLKRGTDDPRHLFPHIARIIRECEPRICFFENVGAHLRLGFREVKSELESLHYRVEAGLFSAEQMGAPHERERLFILAIAERGELQHSKGNSNNGKIWNNRRKDISTTWRASRNVADAKHRNDGRRDESEPDTTRQEILQPGDRTRGADRALDGSASMENTQRNGRRGRSDGDTPARKRSLEIARHCSELEHAALAQGTVTSANRDGQHQGAVGKSSLDFPTADSFASYDEIGLYPPRPDEHDAWRAVLDRFPFGAPALQKASQSDVYRMADGVAVGLDESIYKEQLSCVGNAVSPIVAGFAFRVLAKRIGLNVTGF